MAELKNGSINIDTKKLLDDVTEMLGRLSAMKTCMEQIRYYSDVNNQNWSSRCGDKLYKEQSDIITEMEKTFDSYNALIVFLENTASKYSTTENAVRKSGSAFSD